LIGLAREVAAVTGASLRWPETEPVETGPAIEDRLDVEVRDPDLCPRFVGRFVDGVTVGPSPDRVQMRLRAAGLRPISNVVDTSNYVMLELGKPIHTYDAAGVGERDGRHRLIVRRATPGETLVTLDHVERTLDPETLVIADDRGPLGIAGIMGGADSEVHEATTQVIIESAVFDPIAIRRAGQRYALRSEASLRFEKGVERRLARIGADRTARLIAEWAGGSVSRGRIDTAPAEPPPTRVAFRPTRVNRLLGTDLPRDEQRGVLARVGIETEPGAGREVSVPVSAEPQPLTIAVPPSDAIVAVVPTWRRDIAIEADVAEEIARIHGYEHVPGTLPDTQMPPFRPQPLELRDVIRETLAGAGLTEVVSHALVSPRLAERFTWETPLPMVGAGPPAAARPIHVTNPLSADHSVLRPTVVGSLVEIVSTNVRRGRADASIFEIGKGYGREGDETREWWRLAIAACGAAEEPAWNRPARAFDLHDAKGLIELICRRLGMSTPAYEPITGEPLLHPGRAARVTAERDGRMALAGLVGELHPGIADEWELRGARVVVAELDVAGLAGGAAVAVKALTPSRHPVSGRDLAIVVPESTPAAAVAAVIRENAGPDLVSVDLFDIYRGAPLAANEKSLAWRLVFQAVDRTLTEPEIEAAVATIGRAVATIGGRIRT
jgi:phenylalanyl-tRNA synthetase beta chain